MRKTLYILLAVIIILAIVLLARNHDQPQRTLDIDTLTTVEQNADGSLAIEGNSTGIISDQYGSSEEDAEEVIEENPDETAGDMETIIKE